MNVFGLKEVADQYDAYYDTPIGEEVDKLEKEALQSVMKDITPGKMLEIGCGTGHWTSFFSKLGFKITATDVSEPMMKFAIDKNIANADFQIANVTELPFKDASFDQVAVITALEFCGDIPKAFSEIYRVLKPEGWLITGCLNAESELGKNKENDEVFKHAELMNKEELANYLKTFGNSTIIDCVKMTSSGEVIDRKAERDSTEGMFMAASVQKIK